MSVELYKKRLAIARETIDVGRVLGLLVERTAGLSDLQCLAFFKRLSPERKDVIYLAWCVGVDDLLESGTVEECLMFAELVEKFGMDRDFFNKDGLYKGMFNHYHNLLWRYLELNGYKKPISGKAGQYIGIAFWSVLMILSFWLGYFLLPKLF